MGFRVQGLGFWYCRCNRITESERFRYLGDLRLDIAGDVDDDGDDDDDDDDDDDAEDDDDDDDRRFSRT